MIQSLAGPGPVAVGIGRIETRSRAHAPAGVAIPHTRSGSRKGEKSNVNAPSI